MSAQIVTTAAIAEGRARCLLGALVVYVLPFLYGAATRLPFIYFVIHLSLHFKMSWLNVGFCVAAYQILRVPPSCLAIIAPRAAHALGALAGLAGYLAVWSSDHSRVDVFVAGTAAVALSETLSSMQIYLKTYYSAEKKVLEQRIKVQYASVMVGVTFAFGCGGVIYESHGIDGVAAFGTVIMALQVAALLAFLAAERCLPAALASSSVVEHVLDDGVHATIFDEEAAAHAAHCTVASDDADGLHTPGRSTALIDSFAASGLPASFLNYVIALSIGTEAITIGYNLSIGPIFILSEFNQPVSTIGILFAVGAASGTLAAMSATMTPLGQRLMHAHMPMPYNVYVSMAGIGVAALVAAVPSFGVHVAGLLLLMAANDFAATILTELQSTATPTATSPRRARSSAGSSTRSTRGPLWGYLKSQFSRDLVEFWR